MAIRFCIICGQQTNAFEICEDCLEETGNLKISRNALATLKKNNRKGNFYRKSKFSLEEEWIINETKKPTLPEDR